MSQERFLVTGAMGCLGTWTVAGLVREQVDVTAFDLSEDDYRWSWLMSDDERNSIKRLTGDLTDIRQVTSAVADNGITHIVHLGGLQFPFCKAEPIRGANVNIMGTANLFAASLDGASVVRGISYASSASVFGHAEMYPQRTVADDSPQSPGSFYGVYKQTNESMAMMYHNDHGLGSVGLRPPIVYGMGRDQGVSATYSLAMRAASRGESFRIGFDGTVALGYAEDVATDFIRAARAELQAAKVHNNRARSHTVDQIIAEIDQVTGRPGLVTQADNSPEGAVERVDDSFVSYLLSSRELTTLSEGVRATIQGYKRGPDHHA